MEIEDLLVDFDEMGFAPTTLCENPEEYARAWKRQLIREIERLKAELVKEFAEVDNMFKEYKKWQNKK